MDQALRFDDNVIRLCIKMYDETVLVFVAPNNWAQTIFYEY